VTYTKSLEWLFSTQEFGIKLGLENTRKLLAELGNPQAGNRFIHVAGTNGKGSVCAMMESILRRAGYRTGLFTSPHLIEFCERIQVNGREIPKDFVVNGLTQIRDLTGAWGYYPTFFEITTALGLSYFSCEKCDVVVLETGMGGRLDATNAVEPMVSVLTPVALDHQQWLGASLAEIAAEKGGIIKRGIPVVSLRQDPEAAFVFEKIARENQSPITFVSEPLEKMKIGLMGNYQKLNAALAVAAIRHAGLEVPEEAIRSGLESVNWPGRFQVMEGRCVLDGAHNPAGVAQLAQTWLEYFPNQKPVVIFGSLKDKDASGMIANLRRIAARFVFVSVDSGRSESPDRLKELAATFGLDSVVCSSLKQALREAGSQDRILIAGSLFLVGEALAHLRGKDSPHRRSLQ